MKNVNGEGLSTARVYELQKKFGKNEIVAERKRSLVFRITEAVLEPIFLMLIFASVIYFLLGEANDGMIMLIFVFGIIVMDVVQEWKTDRTLTALKNLSQPMIAAVRDGKVTKVPSIELVPGDVILAEEGSRIPADGYILTSHDFCTDESILTGESGDVWKTPAQILPGDKNSTELTAESLDNLRTDYCYAGTMVTQGNASILVNKTGNETAYGKIGLSMTDIKPKLTPLQRQMKTLTKHCTIIAIFLLFIVSFVTYFNLTDNNLLDRVIESLLSGIVLSLSMIPAEFPVILTVFLSMGALRLTKKHALIRKLSAAETLGAVSVICVDKTGTITKNQMSVEETFYYQCEETYLAQIAALACDNNPFDPMEKAILTYCEKLGLKKQDIFGNDFIKGYPFTQKCKIMTHVWKIDGTIVAAAKGSPEWLISHSTLPPEECGIIENKTHELFKKGLRVIAVGLLEIKDESEIPLEVTEYRFTFCGLLGFMDPPKDSIMDDIRKCKEAGIRLVMITGDNGDTAASVAKQIQFPGNLKPVTGKELDEISDSDLPEILKKVNIFSRVVPEQKLRIVKGLIANGEIVAMTGDGVNDAPALKNANIGIAMGLKGSEVTKEAADLILLDDNFSTILDSVEDGRRIYDNIRKAIGYVFTIHIPIALICLFGPLLHILPCNLMLLPLHVILLELIMNPTCAAAIERQPSEVNTMKRGPRKPEEQLLTKEILIKSILQGLAIFLGSFGSYYFYLIRLGENAAIARSIGLSVLILSNLFLVLVNASERESVFRSFYRIKREKGIIVVLATTFFLLLFILYGPLQSVLLLSHINLKLFFNTVFIAVVSVFWYELIKIIRKKFTTSSSSI
ncbi:cation-translocating P-type ATPase [Anaerocolumna sp. MB42-C2]|uniref:cation-translocating P-type ATPase n=1 Tax=Anaerocolumna sp. MB42-C2 TaxID=3070997 RepID=UPI0027DF05A5|nr:cation-translocating P-type ATPase [Anaerocolumna sp. MB42-C2]WMJ85973.1 cation-translocating P-type ATPase [Anaerocolumna sp. MB42-C2]